MAQRKSKPGQTPVPGLVHSHHPLPFNKNGRGPFESPWQDRNRAPTGRIIPFSRTIIPQFIIWNSIKPRRLFSQTGECLCIAVKSGLNDLPEDHGTCPLGRSGSAGCQSPSHTIPVKKGFYFFFRSSSRNFSSGIVFGLKKPAFSKAGGIRYLIRFLSEVRK
jgi:hypothetical protein